MEAAAETPLVSTIKERCRVCYTCVRECPAKAIRIKGGQAAVLEERCVGCGNCVQVCGQQAKQYRRATEVVHRLLLRSEERVAALLAPSFPAEFADVSPRALAGMLRALGFATVHEVAFGADLVARRYAQLAARSAGRRWIATTCPAVVGYVERYHPALVDALAPIVSPMLAMTRALHRMYGEGLRVVFIGPCIAKKREALSGAKPGEIAAVLTWAELRDLLRDAGLSPGAVQESDFDAPRAGSGALFPLGGGLLEAAGLDRSLANGERVSAEGRRAMIEVLEELEAGTPDSGLIELLACRGCVMGPGMTTRRGPYARRAAVAAYVRASRAETDEVDRRDWVVRFDDLDLERHFAADDQRLTGPNPDELEAILARLGKQRAGDELNCGACGYDTCRAHARAIHAGLAESEMCLPFAIDSLRRTVEELGVRNQQLASAQETLLHVEKLASMGQLAAGIAHEVNNPLAVVLMYAHLLRDECPPDSAMQADLALIAEQADRCKRIVSGLLNFARQNRVVPQPVELHELLGSVINAAPPPANIEVRTGISGDPRAELDREQMIQVLTNLVRNAYDAMPCGGQLELACGGGAEKVWFRVRDSGTGIAPQHMAKLFEPFFTTKPPGKGTGLGLPVSYGIVKMHHGEIKVESNFDPARGPSGTTFTVTLPRRAQQE